LEPRRLYLLQGFWAGATFGAYGLAVMVWWVVDLGLSPLPLVVLGTVMELTVLLAESPTGAVADLYSRKWSVVISWVVVGAAQVLTALSGTLALLLLWQAVWGFGYTFQSGADTAWVTDEIGEADDGLVLRRMIFRLLGVVVGVSAGMVATQWSLTGAVALSGIAAVAFGGFLALTMSERNFRPVDRAGGSWRAMVGVWRQGAGVVTGSRTLGTLAVAAVLIGSADELVDRLDLARMRQVGFPDLDGAGSALWFGGIWVGMTLLTLPVMVLVARRVDEVEAGHRTLAALAGGLLVVGSVGVGLMAGSVFAAAIVGWILRDVVREVVDPLTVAWVNRQAPSEVRATVLSLHGQAGATGEIVGGLLLAGLAELAGLQPAFVGAAALLALAALLIGRLGTVATA
jgi:DHA3 family tetracycline resistance protein-like MFS transporter